MKFCFCAFSSFPSWLFVCGTPWCRTGLGKHGAFQAPIQPGCWISQCYSTSPQAASLLSPNSPLSLSLPTLVLTSSLDSILAISCSVLHTSLYKSSSFSLFWGGPHALLCPLSPVSHILLFSSDRGFHPMHLTTTDTSLSSHSSLLSAMLLQLTSFHITHQKDFTFFSCSVHLTHNFKKGSPVFPWHKRSLFLLLKKGKWGTSTFMKDM